MYSSAPAPYGRIPPQGNNQGYQRRPQLYQAPGQVNPIYDVRNNYDIRLIVFRHGERLDQSVGKGWYEKIFAGVPSAPREAYRHPLLPHRLPHRTNTLMYEFDPPISRKGELESLNRGKQVALSIPKIDYCYSSPASRSVLTASAILRGMNQSQVPIRTERLLFEPMSWNSPLQLLKNMDPFLTPTDWKQAGHNVDRHYQPLLDRLPPYGTELDYFDRSAAFFSNLVKHYGSAEAPAGHAPNAKRRVNIVVVGHASTTEVLSMIAMNDPFDIPSFTERTKNVGYLHAAVIERDATTKRWIIPHTVVNN